MKILKWTGIVTGILLLLFIALHIWINYTAKHILQDLVETRSKGRLKMKIEKFRFSWFSRKVELHNTAIYSTDTVNSITGYRFHVDHIKLSAQEIWPILFEKKLLIDSLNLDHPEITVTRIKPLPGKEKKKEVSIPEELGKIYNSVQEALQALRVNRFQVEEAKFTLLNKVQPGQLPLSISHIHFHIDNLSVSKKNKGEKDKLLFSDNVALSSRNQDIVFPDGRHRLAFSTFRINLKQQLVEFDSCTILTEQKEDAPSRFRVFMDTLRLSHIDFDTLYRTEVIKADSVYCLSPRFDLEVENSRKKEAVKKKGPRLEDIIQQLTGDLLLGTVLVNNADFHIKVNISERPASFNFTNNTFELQGLKVSAQSPKPLTVKNVALAIRNYENFIRDSTYKLSFDSILIKEDKVYLDRFVLNKYLDGKITSRFEIPQFELSGLSWDDLVFNQQLKAREATLYNPVINYNTATSAFAARGKQSIFTTLGNIGQIIQLDKMNIAHGKIDIALKNNNAVRLDDASVSISTRTLFRAKKARAIEPAVDYLDFKTGLIRAGNLDINLKNVVYTGSRNGFLLAKEVQVNDREKKLQILAENAAVDDVLTDEETGDITATGIRWDRAKVDLKIPEKPLSKGPYIELNKLRGKETTLTVYSGSKQVKAFITSVSADEIKKGPGAPFATENLLLSGTDFQLLDSGLSLAVNNFHVQEGAFSTLTDVVFKNTRKGNQLSINIPELKIRAAINPLLSKQFRFDEVVATRPVLAIQTKKGNRESLLPAFAVSKLQVLQPVVHFTTDGNRGHFAWEWNGLDEPNNSIQAWNLALANGESPVYHADSLALHMDHFTYTSPAGRKFNAGRGELETLITGINYYPLKGQPDEWSAAISQLAARRFVIDSIGRKKGQMEMKEAVISSMNISSETITSPYKLVEANTRFRLENFSGQYADTLKKFTWENAGFNQQTGFSSFDSFSYTPVPVLDTFLSRLSFQKDYISTGCGKVKIGPIDRNSFTRDSVFRAGKISISDAWFNDYKDKRLPFAAGSIRPLPVELIRKIPAGISVDTVELTGARVSYTEINEKNNAKGVVPISKLTIRLLHVNNRYLQPGDSLDIQATGYVMDSIWTRLKVRAAYLDSLAGFRMTLRAKAENIRVLNPVLIPLVNVKLNSGEIDTISLRATGREYLALGELKMFYRDLRIRFLRSGRDERQAFVTRLKSFAANSFVLRKNNKSRTGDVFFIRKRDRSAINYLLRIVISGMASSTGAKSNKKMIRRYQRELKVKGLPPFDPE